MAARSYKQSSTRSRARSENATADRPRRSLCAIRLGAPRPLAPSIGGERTRLIVMNREKWVNGTVLHYAFFENAGIFKKWSGSEALKSQVRKAFQRWTALGIGVRFEEVKDRAQAEIRIGFERDDGHWSYIGRVALEQGLDDRTLNLDPGDGIDSGEYGVDVACHEIGHSLGFPHEHQNPHAGIVWNEEAVYADLAGSPNFWDRDKTYYNIIRKISADSVQGSAWDPDSIMHYPFGPGLIDKPERYRNGLQPAGGLSARDRDWVRTFYPPTSAKDDTALPLLESRRLQIDAGQTKVFVLKPAATRYYEIRTFGTLDAVAVLYRRETNGQETYLTADDDSGEERNAYIRRRLHAGRVYVVKVRLYYAADAGETGIMWW